MSSTPHASRAQTTTDHVVLGVDLTAAGARPGVHRPRGPVTALPFDAARFVSLVRDADRGLLDLVVLDEGFLLHPGRRRVTGRLDAAVAATRVAPHTLGIGLVAAIDTFHVEPAHAAAAVASVDRASAGRAGWQVALPTAPPVPDDVWAARAEPGVKAVTSVWDGTSVADGTVALDAEGRFRVDHDGVRFAVRASGTGEAEPFVRSRPPVVVRVRSESSAAFAGRAADVARIAVTDVAHAVRLRTLVRDAAAAAGRDPDALRVIAEAYVVLAADVRSAQARLELLEVLEGPEVADGALVFAGTASELAVLAAEWHAAGAVDGFLLRPSSLGPDLDSIVDHLVPRLQRAGLFRTERTSPTLRGSLGLPESPGPAAARRAVPVSATRSTLARRPSARLVNA